MKSSKYVGLAVVILAVVGTISSAEAATVTWKGHVDNNWDETTANWNNTPTVYTDGDTAHFINHGKGNRQVLTIDAGGISPGAITMAYWQGEVGSYEFTGGDITGTGTFTMSSDGVLHLPQSFSFSGGSFLTHQSTQLLLEPTAAGTYHFGTGPITLNAAWKVNGAQFSFHPTVAATNDNDFVVLGGGGSLRGNANASWSGNVDLQAVLGLTGSQIWSGMTFNLSNDNGGIEFYRFGSGSFPRFDGNVQGATHDFTFGDGITSGSITDYEIVIDTASTFNVNNLILDSGATIFVVEGTDSQTVFDDVNGKVVVQGNTVLATEGGSSGSNYASLNGTYYAENDYELHAGTFTRIVADNILVQDGGSISGDGLLQGHTGGVTVNDGTLAPGFSIGTLNVDGNLNLTSSSILDFELGSPGDSDLIAIDGDLVLDGTMNITLLESLPADVLHNYTLFTYTGNLTGSELNLIMPSGALGFLDFSTNGVVGLNVLLPVPEPNTLMMLMAGIVGLSFRRKRKAA